MVNTAVTCLVMLIGGLMASALWVFVIGIAGFPGAMLMGFVRQRIFHDGARAAALFVVVAGQLLAALTWAAFVIGSTHALASNRSVMQRAALLACGVLVANFPGGMAARDAERGPNDVYLFEIANPQHGAIFMTVPITILVSVLFAVFPTVMRFGLGWVPRLFA